jgi:hypothetical protein
MDEEIGWVGLGRQTLPPYWREKLQVSRRKEKGWEREEEEILGGMEKMVFRTK